MNYLKPIRLRLGMTQQAMASELGCTQGNIGHYERGSQTFSPDSARKLIQVAQARGLTISFDHIYGAVDLPPADGQEPGHA
jgi:putative transcriptional regulator